MSKPPKNKIFIPRKGSRTTASVSKQGTNPQEVGERAVDFIQAVKKTDNPKARSAQFEQMVQWSRVCFESVIANRDKCRSMVPIIEKKRVRLTNKKVERDVEFINATYASFNREDYILTQSPTKDSVGEFWRMVWQDGCKLILCLIETNGFGIEDEKCFQYFPKEEDKPLIFLDGRYTIKMVKKWENKGFCTYDLSLSSTDEPEVKDDKTEKTEKKVKDKSDHEEDKSKPITLMHFFDWKENDFPDVDKLGPFVHAASNKELHIIKRITDDYVPPVILQGQFGLNRSCALWVLLILMKQIERRDCFDVENLIRHLIRFRPGAFNNEMVFFSMFATAFRIAQLGGWSTSDEAKDRVKEIKLGAKQHIKATTPSNKLDVTKE